MEVEGYVYRPPPSTTQSIREIMCMIGACSDYIRDIDHQ